MGNGRDKLKAYKYVALHQKFYTIFMYANETNEIQINEIK